MYVRGTGSASLRIGSIKIKEKFEPAPQSQMLNSSVDAFNSVFRSTGSQNCSKNLSEK